MVKSIKIEIESERGETLVKVLNLGEKTFIPPRAEWLTILEIIE